MAADDELITVLCAWCGLTLRPGGGRVSHGICRECAPVLLAKIRERLNREDSVRHGPEEQQGADLRQLRNDS